MAAKKKTTTNARKAAHQVSGPRVITDPETARRPAVGLPPAPRRHARGDDDNEVARQEAFDADYVWKGKPLHPFTSSRESLWIQQRKGAGAPGLEVVLDPRDVDIFFPDACRILYLCSHTPEDYRHLRLDPLAFQDAIDEWTDSQIPRTRGDTTRLDAIVLGFNIYNQSRVNQHEAAPPRVKGGEDVGN